MMFFIEEQKSMKTTLLDMYLTVSSTWATEETDKALHIRLKSNDCGETDEHNLLHFLFLLCCLFTLYCECGEMGFNLFRVRWKYGVADLSVRLHYSKALTNISMDINRYCSL